MSRTTIPKPLRKQMETDPEYKVCMLYGHHNHVCGGRITREHTIIFAGKSYQARWSIISLCARGHGVDEFQDNHEMRKELNVWIALNRATYDELQAISKVDNYPMKRERLNRLYGLWAQKNPPISYLQTKGVSPLIPTKKTWFCVEDADMAAIREIQTYLKSQEDYDMPYPDVIRTAIQKAAEAVRELKNNIQIT